MLSLVVSRALQARFPCRLARAGRGLFQLSCSHGFVSRGGLFKAGFRGAGKGCEFGRRHGSYFLSGGNRLGNRLGGEFFLSGGSPVDQREFPLLGRLDAPSAVPNQWIRHAKSYRQAVRLAWSLRRVQNMTKQQLASEAELYPQHVTDYLAEDDKPSRRDLPADAVARFEGVVGNTLVSQWLASRSKLTVLEEMQATRIAA